MARERERERASGAQARGGGGASGGDDCLHTAHSKSETARCWWLATETADRGDGRLQKTTGVCGRKLQACTERRRGRAETKRERGTARDEIISP